MIYDQHDHFIRLTLQHCKAMEFFFKMVHSAEQELNKAAMREKDLQFVISFGRIVNPAFDGSIVVLVLRLQQGFKENMFFREELKIEGPINLDFIRTMDAPWIAAVDDFFKLIASRFFATGLFGLCRVHIQDGEYKEEDIQTL
jgi:hypothetical protein